MYNCYTSNDRWTCIRNALMTSHKNGTYLIELAVKITCIDMWLSKFSRKYTFNKSLINYLISVEMPQFFILDIRIDTSFSGQFFMIHIWNLSSLYGTSEKTSVMKEWDMSISEVGCVNIRGGTWQYQRWDVTISEVGRDNIRGGTW